MSNGLFDIILKHRVECAKTPNFVGILIKGAKVFLSDSTKQKLESIVPSAD